MQHTHLASRGQEHLETHRSVADVQAIRRDTLANLRDRRVAFIMQKDDIDDANDLKRLAHIAQRLVV